MRSRFPYGNDPAANKTLFISGFTGSNHYSIDYLADELLHYRPQGTKEFLLRTL